MSAVSILDILATLPSGKSGGKLTLPQLGAYLKEYCDRPEDKERNDRHERRDDLYRDSGVRHLEKLIDEVFENGSVKDRLKKFAPYARFNNALKRIVNELSTVYTEPAARSVAAANDNAKYGEVLEQVQVDEHAQEWNRLYNLHRSLLVGFRVRELPDTSREPLFDIVTPSTWRVVLHPNDSKLVVGHLIRVKFRTSKSVAGWIRTAAWVLWTDFERVHLDESFMPIDETYLEHKLGVCPYVPVTRAIAVAGFWPGEEGEDLVTGQLIVMLTSLLLVKETKSATKLPVVKGPSAEMVRGQEGDTDGQISVPADVAIEVVDISMDTSIFTDATGHIVDGLANNHGMAGTQVRNGVQSAEAREVLRIPIRELRRQQLPAFRLFERRLARVMAAVLLVDDSARAFGLEGWKVVFGEEQAPLTENERLALHERKRQLGLDNPYDFVSRENPDMKLEAAVEFVNRNITLFTLFVASMRELQAMGAGPSTGPLDSQQNVQRGDAQNDQQQQGPVAEQAA